MRYLLFSAAVIVGAVWMGSMPATATPASGHSPNVGVKLVEEVGYWRRQYRRYYRYGYGYAAPYAYYPPAYAYYPPAPVYGYYAPYRYYAPYYRPYYAPY
jgi:hypothetical protein